MAASRYNKGKAHRGQSISALCLILLELASTLTVSAGATSQRSQPLLQAIDPSLAKMDTSASSAPAQAPSPNPLGGIYGSPLNGAGNGSSFPVPESQYQYPAPQMVQGNGSGQPAAYQGYNPLPQSGAAPSYPPENMIPDFNKPLPQSQPGPGRQQPGSGSAEEVRITRLEQTAFGSTYPEHELDERLDHLEKEVLGAPTSGPTEQRLAHLEAKLGGGGAFTPTAAPSSDVRETPTLAQMPAEPAPAAPIGLSPWQTPELPPSKLNTLPVTVSSTPSPQIPVSKMPLAQNSLGLPAPPPAISMLGSSKMKHERTPDSTREQSSSKRRPESEDQDDYFDAITKFAGNTVVRWRDVPVRVHLPVGSPESWQRSLDNGIKRWNEYMPLRVVPASVPADIEVVWVNRLVPQYLGITRLFVPAGQMKVTVFLLRPTYYLPQIPERVLQNAFLHELGHALGIFGHSDNKQDLMFASEITPGPKGKPPEIHFAGMSERDINTLKHIYETEAVPADFSMPQPLEWGLHNDDPVHS